MWHLGRQTVGIVTDVPVLDGLGNPVVSEFHQPQTTESVVWVRNCLFEVQESALPRRTEEQRHATTVVNTIAWVFLPVTHDGLIPAFDARVNGNAVAPVDPATVTAAKALRYDHDYEMRGDAILEDDINGRPDHVYALCEYQAG